MRTLAHEAVDQLRIFERREAAARLRRYLAETYGSGEQWKSIARLADRMGEIDLSIEAMRRYAATSPVTLERFLAYCSELATRGRVEECLAQIESLAPQGRNHETAILHLQGAIATQLGEFEAAERYIRQTLKQAPMVGQHWLALAMIKRFSPSDADYESLKTLAPKFNGQPASSYAPFLYAIGKAHHDCENYDVAFQAFSEGAALKRIEYPYDAHQRFDFTNALIRDFTRENLTQLTPSHCMSDRPIFVTGLPRSGTTLVEQILTSHSKVSGGAELNLFRAALIPTQDYSFDGAIKYQLRAKNTPDPWGALASDYLELLTQRFGPNGRIVDKTLNHSRFMGLILHSMPNAKVVWLRRDPEDTALSCFRNYFASTIKWAWSLEDIGHYFKCDDRLHAHWSGLFPDRILTVSYEDLVTDPTPWIERILDFVDLPRETDVFRPHQQKKRPVLTASVAQVRNPISTRQVGASAAYKSHLAPFRDAYTDESI